MNRACEPFKCSVQEVAIARAALTLRLCVMGSGTDSDESAFGSDLDEGKR